MKTGILCRFALLCCVVLSGAAPAESLGVGGRPLPRAEVRMRVMTRGFYHDLTAAVARTADSIADAAPGLADPHRSRALEDAGVVGRRGRGHAHHPRGGARRHVDPLPPHGGRPLPQPLTRCCFGDLTPQARRTVRSLSGACGALARDVLSRDRYALMREFVDAYAAAHPITGDGAETPNTTPRMAHLPRIAGRRPHLRLGVDRRGDRRPGRPGGRPLASAGRDRGGGRKTSSKCGWSRTARARSSLRQIDSLDRNFRRMAAVMEHIPEISTFVAETFGERVGELIEAMDASVNHAFVQLDRQRDELQRYVSAERGELMRDVDPRGRRHGACGARRPAGPRGQDRGVARAARGRGARTAFRRGFLAGRTARAGCAGAARRKRGE